MDESHTDISDNSSNRYVTPPKNVTLSEAFWYWLKLGFISFGGPAGQIAIMHQDLVERMHWISERRFLHALNYCMLLPGPEAQQLAIYIGWLLHRTWGGIIAGVLFVLPSLFILIALSWIYIAFGDVPLVAGIFYGIKPAVTAIVFQAAYRIGSRTIKNSFLFLIAVASFIAIFILKIPFPFIVATAALIGFIGGIYRPQNFHINKAHGKTNISYGAALIDDHTPTPEHAKFSWVRLSSIIVTGLLLWLIPILFLTVLYSWNHDFTQMAWFFTKAALLTFGGAYAVLPYIYQGAVEFYGWLTPEQMIDGLALGEATPGPLIMVVAFVAFIGGYVKELLEPDMLFIAGSMAAIIVTWFTFLPSFIFILAGGPIVESTHDNLKFTAPLTAITAAIVGVILNLAMFFGYHVLWPQGFIGEFDWISASITIIAAIALFRFKRNVLEVISLCGIIGLGAKLIFL